MGVLYATSVKWRLDDNKNPCTNITCRVHIVVRLQPTYIAQLVIYIYKLKNIDIDGVYRYIDLFS